MMKRLFLFPILAAIGFLTTPAPAQVSNPFNPDIAWCNTQGAIAYRSATKWQCLNPGTSGYALVTQGPSANPTWLAVGGTGTVTSVGLTVPSFFSVSGSPVTGSGTLAVTANSQSQNLALMSPNGSSGVPSFRALAYADLPTIGNNGLLSNISGGTAVPASNSLSAIMDSAFSSARGSLAYRSTGGWVALAPGTSGTFLRTAGAGADPTWAAVSGATGGTVTTITAGTGISLSSGATCTLTCTVSLPSIASGHVMGNGTGSSTTATDSTLTTVLDQAFSSTQGSILYRGASAWAALGPGTSGQVLQSGGAGANPAWAAVGGTSYTLKAATSVSGTNATATFTSLTNVNDIIVKINDVTNDSNGRWDLQFSADNGSTWNSGALQVADHSGGGGCTIVTASSLAVGTIAVNGRSSNQVGGCVSNTASGGVSPSTSAVSGYYQASVINAVRVRYIIGTVTTATISLWYR